jgi:hypothetical protein
MAKKKSSTKDLIINLLLIVATGLVLTWRYNDCKEKEKQAEMQAQELRDSEKKQFDARQKTCIESVPESERSDCIKCTCDKCLDAFESCHADPNCRTMSIQDVLKDGGPSAEDPARIRFETRASCMLEKCNEACTEKK